LSRSIRLSYLASFEAVRYLLQKHPEHAPYAVTLGTESGTDVFSSDGAVVAELFAAVRPTNNRKLARDVEKVAAAGGLVVSGRFRMDLRDRQVWVDAGEPIVVPRGVEHCPHADEEVSVLFFEPASTLNTGNVRSSRTVDQPERI
jgi:hypothetical protein